MKVRHLVVKAGCAFAMVGSAHAEWESLAFTFEPLQCTYQNYPPSAPPMACSPKSLSGMFTYDDVNGDGHIELSELVHLQAGAIAAPGPGHLVPAQVYSFDYSEQKGLHFSAYDGWRYNITTGVSYRYDGPSGNTIYTWTPATTTRIYPVPEPASAWLLLAGGAGLAWRMRCHRARDGALA